MKLKLKLKKGKSNSAKNRQIKNQLTRIIVCFVVVCCLLLGVMTSLLNYKTANHVLTDTVEQVTIQAAENAESKIKTLQNAAIQTGAMKDIADPNVSIEEKQKIITNQENIYGLKRGKIIDANGYNLFDGENYGDREYFKVAMSGKEFMSSPVISKVTGQIAFVSAAPIWENGIQGSKVIGIVTFVPDENFLNDIINGIKISENSYAYLLNKEGTTIADEDASAVGEENIIELSKTNKDYEAYAEADRKLISGERGVSNLKIHGEDWVLGYAPVENTDGWGLGVMASKGDFLTELYSSVAITVVLAILLTIIAFIVARRFANKIGNPLKDCSERLEKLAEGDLNSEIVVVDEDNEIGLVATATTKIVQDFRGMISSLTHILTEVSNGNLNIEVNNEELNNLFVNDFEPMLVAVNKIVDSLNETLSQINVSSEQVAAGSDQVASGAQLLSQGATEQASSIEELSATIHEVSMQIKQTAENAVRAKEISEKSSEATTKGKEQMQDMIVAMDEISQTSNEIGNIIKNIDDIAFQTNILALNAAVEAARAGNAGKGFAVVADEVRNLAAKSAQSAKDTAELIEKALIAIDNGTKIVSETAKSLEDVVEGAQNSAKVIQHIADASNEQAEHISQVNVGVEQISVVVQTNSATAEESAAASEELSSQAQMLKELIRKFKLKDTNNYFDTENFFSNEDF